MQRIGSPSVYGKVYKACVNVGVNTNDYKRLKSKKKCLRICDSKIREIKERCSKYNRYKYRGIFYVAIKIQILNTQESSTYKLARKRKILPWNDLENNNYPLWREIYANRMMVLLLKYNVVPTVSLMFEPYLCNACNAKRHPCIIIINELSKGDLHHWLMKKRNDIEILSAFFQIFVTLFAIQLNYKMVHNDLHWGNVLYTPVDDEIWTFKLKSTRNKPIATFDIPTNGYLFKLADFGRVDMAFFPLTYQKMYFTDAYRILFSLYNLKNTDIEKPSKAIQKWASAVSNLILINMNKTKYPSINQFGGWIKLIFSPEYLRYFGLPTFEKYSILKAGNRKDKAKTTWNVRRDLRINRWIRNNL